MATVFIGKDAYEKYKSDTQGEITTTGSIIKNVYVQEDITYKATNISVEQDIFVDSKELSQYLLYGNNNEKKIVTVKTGDSIPTIAFENEVSVEEILLSNPEFTSRDNLLYEGKQIEILKMEPKINIVVEKYNVTDVETNYNIVEQYDSSLAMGSELVTQEGEKGVDRVTQNIKLINGQTAYIEPISKNTIKTSVSKVITLGTRRVSNVGSTSSWLWPINSYTISSYFQYRFSPITGRRELHTGLDIASKYGTPIYAANNGTVEQVNTGGSYGYNIIINHGNGYWTLYAHMSRFAAGIRPGTVVSRGDVIGYVGTTGAATGPHLHFEIRKGCSKYGCYVDPLPYYR
jgi:murein DD-endopeptidase MepM/ murein hydrolase activator NlpD